MKGTFWGIGFCLVLLLQGCANGAQKVELTPNPVTTQRDGGSAAPLLPQNTNSSSVTHNTAATKKMCLTPVAASKWGKAPPRFATLLNNPEAAIGNLLGDMADHTLTQTIFGSFGGAGAFQIITQIDRSLNSLAGLKTKRSMPICGNWCGSGYPAPNSNPPAIDKLDEVCRFHDLCYRKYGNYNCKCDEALVKFIRHGRPIVSLSAKEMQIVLLFMGSPCRGGCKVFKSHQVCGK